MAVKRTKATDKKNFTLEPRFPAYVGYADYFLATPVTLQVRNDFTEAVTLTISIASEDGLLVPYETRAEVPFESAVELTAERIFSPSFWRKTTRSGRARSPSRRSWRARRSPRSR